MESVRFTFLRDGLDGAIVKLKSLDFSASDMSEFQAVSNVFRGLVSIE